MGLLYGNIIVNTIALIITIRACIEIGYSFKNKVYFSPLVTILRCTNLDGIILGVNEFIRVYKGVEPRKKKPHRFKTWPKQIYLYYKWLMREVRKLNDKIQNEVDR